jgi:RNA polymerase sigma-70 factor (ECF subfamily)
MFGTCLRMCGNREDAEDVLQGSFADVYSKLDYFRGDSTIGAWIKRIVINNCLNHLKRRRLHFAELNDELAPAEETVEEEDCGHQVEMIRAAISRLPDGYRTVISLYLFEGYDHAEIAEVLSISEQTSKSQYSRARKRLREELEIEKLT